MKPVLFDIDEYSKGLYRIRVRARTGAWGIAVWAIANPDPVEGKTYIDLGNGIHLSTGEPLNENAVNIAKECVSSITVFLDVYISFEYYLMTDYQDEVPALIICGLSKYINGSPLNILYDVQFDDDNEVVAKKYIFYIDDLKL